MKNVKMFKKLVIVMLSLVLVAVCNGKVFAADDDVFTTVNSTNSAASTTDNNTTSTGNATSANNTAANNTSTGRLPIVVELTINVGTDNDWKLFESDSSFGRNIGQK